MEQQFQMLEDQFKKLVGATFTAIDQQNVFIADNKKSIALLTEKILELEGRLFELENFIDKSITKDIGEILDKKFKELEDKLDFQRSIKEMSSPALAMYTGGKRRKTRKTRKAKY